MRFWDGVLGMILWKDVVGCCLGLWLSKFGEGCWLKFSFLFYVGGLWWGWGGLKRGLNVVLVLVRCVERCVLIIN